MIIKNGTVLNDGFNWENKDISFKNGVISANENEDEYIDASGMYVVPGFIDTHMHGAMGKTFIDFKDDTKKVIAEFEAKNGTTSLVPAISAAPFDKLILCIEYMKKCTESTSENEAKIYGMHLEGPFFAEKYKGAHLLQNIRNTDKEEFKKYIKKANGCIKIITLAPELQNADEVIKEAVKENVCVSLGHSNATYDDAICAFNIGASQSTHLFNAMSPMNHRNPGLVGATLTSGLRAELICDFFHIHKSVVKLAIDIKGYENINMITDSEIGTGLPDGDYEVNGRTITVKDNKTYTDDGAIAGGTSCLIDGVRNLVSIGIPLEKACMMASKNPAQTVGIYDKTGSLTIGKSADILLLDKELNLKKVILRGKIIK